MKKLTAVLITLAVTATMAFAEASISGAAGVKWQVIGDTDGDVDGMQAYTNHAWDNLVNFSAQNEEGTVGANFRLENGGWSASHTYVWWKPIDQFKMQIGGMNSGYWGNDGSIAWNFNGGAQYFVAYNDPQSSWGLSELSSYYSYKPSWGGAFQNFSDNGVKFEIAPIEGLEINFGLPVATAATTTAFSAQAYNLFLGQVAYTLDGIGKFGVGYKNGYTNRHYADGKSAINAFFNFTMVENLTVLLGFKYTLPVSTGEDYGDLKINDPVVLELGAEYNAGDFGIKARFHFDFGGSVKQGSGDATPIPFHVGFGIVPSYELGIVKAYLNAGLEIQTDQENARGDNIGELHMGWYVNPYVTKTIGGATLYAGFQLKGEPKEKASSGTVQKYETTVSWALPVGMSYSF